MRIALCFLVLALLASNTHNITADSQTLREMPTEQEVREAREIATAFIRRIRRTRDIATLKDLYVEDFLRRRQSTATSLHDFGSSLFYRTDLWTEADLHEWERLYAAQVNLRYFMVLYYFANGHEIFTHEPKMSEVYPPEVLAQLKANPFLAEASTDRKYRIETLEDLRSVIATLEHATAVMRERFMKHPPEQTERYRENMRAWVTKESLRDPGVYVQTGLLGFPKGTRFFRLRTMPPLFDLTVVRSDNGMKLVWASVYPFN